MPKLSVVAVNAKAVYDVLDALSEFPLELARVRTDDRGVSLELEVGEEQLLPVLTAIDAMHVRTRPESMRVTLDGHSYFLYSDPRA